MSLNDDLKMIVANLFIIISIIIFFIIIVIIKNEKIAKKILSKIEKLKITKIL